MASAAMESVKAVFTRVGDSLPTLVGSFIILLIGWIVAGWLQKLVVQFLKTVRLDDAAQAVRISEVLQKGEIKYSLSELVGVFLYWLLILSTVLAALNALGLTVAAELLEKVLGYVPSVLAGVIVLVLGLFFSTLVGGVVQTAAANAGISQAKGLGQISRVVVIIFTTIVALEKFFSSSDSPWPLGWAARTSRGGMCPISSTRFAGGSHLYPLDAMEPQKGGPLFGGPPFFIFLKAAE
ncbi:MAG: hypothetical protein HYZ90_05180 [Candidatus Omnitrophica bacterium]|nr:hypothetical protein [Candidatus Omnitrophota bacterium]